MKRNIKLTITCKTLTVELVSEIINTLFIISTLNSENAILVTVLNDHKSTDAYKSNDLVNYIYVITMMFTVI